MVLQHIRECFGCGADNAVSLGVVHSAMDEGVESRVRFGREHQGAPGLVHGGLLATFLDETMGAIPVEVPFTRVTAEMHLRYRRPTPIGTELVCRARAGDVSSGRYTVDATIVDAAAPDVVLVEGRATYVVLDRERRDRH